MNARKEHAKCFKGDLLEYAGVSYLGVVDEVWTDLQDTDYGRKVPYGARNGDWKESKETLSRRDPNRRLRHNVCFKEDKEIDG